MQSHTDAPSGVPVTALSWTRRLTGSTAFRLAVLAFVVYQVNLRPVSSADTFPMRYAPISLLTEGDLDFDEFAFLRAQPAKPPLTRRPLPPSHAGWRSMPTAAWRRVRNCA